MKCETLNLKKYFIWHGNKKSLDIIEFCIKYAHDGV